MTKELIIINQYEELADHKSILTHAIDKCDRKIEKNNDKISSLVKDSQIQAVEGARLQRILDEVQAKIYAFKKQYSE